MENFVLNASGHVASSGTVQADTVTLASPAPIRSVQDVVRRLYGDLQAVWAAGAITTSYFVSPGELAALTASDDVTFAGTSSFGPDAPMVPAIKTDYGIVFLVVRP